MGWGAGRLWWRPVFEHAKSKLVVRSLKSQRQVVLLGRGAVLDGEREMIGLSLDVEVGIAPSMKLGAAAQCLPSAEVVGSFSSVVDDNNGEMKQTLELTEVSQNGGDIGRSVFVDTVEANKGIEEQEPRSKLLDSKTKPLLILEGVESERRSGNDLNIELCEVEMCEMADTFESSAHDLKRIFGGVEENASRVGNGKVSKTR